MDLGLLFQIGGRLVPFFPSRPFLLDKRKVRLSLLTNLTKMLFRPSG